MRYHNWFIVSSLDIIQMLFFPHCSCICLLGTPCLLLCEAVRELTQTLWWFDRGGPYSIFEHHEFLLDKHFEADLRQRWSIAWLVQVSKTWIVEPFAIWFALLQLTFAAWATLTLSSIYLAGEKLVSSLASSNEGRHHFHCMFHQLCNKS